MKSPKSVLKISDEISKAFSSKGYIKKYLATRKKWSKIGIDGINLTKKEEQEVKRIIENNGCTLISIVNQSHLEGFCYDRVDIKFRENK